MNRDNERQSAIILSVIGIIPVVWLALLIAPSISGGLPEIAANLATLFDNPFSIKLCGDSLKTVLILLLCYGMGIGIYFSTRKNYRRREEHGSAKWGNVRAIDKKYRQKPLSENNLITQNVTIGLNAKKHRRNLNTLVCGGSGAGKTRFYVKPNLMQMHSSYVVTDPKGTLVLECGKMLYENGYDIKILNTINFKKSMKYNPFAYLRSEKDILKLVQTIIANTKGDGEKAGEDFWVKAEKLYYTALIGYIYYEAPEEEKNFKTLLDMIDASEVREDDETYMNPIDRLFEALEKKTQVILQLSNTRNISWQQEKLPSQF